MYSRAGKEAGGCCIEGFKRPKGGKRNSRRMHRIRTVADWLYFQPDVQTIFCYYYTRGWGGGAKGEEIFFYLDINFFRASMSVAHRKQQRVIFTAAEIIF
jgi:hypothetical protein